MSTVAVVGTPAGAAPAQPDPSSVSTTPAPGTSSDSVDVLRADAADVHAEIEATVARRAEAETALASARVASSAAAADLESAETAERVAARRAAALDRKVRSAAIAAYVSSGHDMPLGIIAQDDLRDASWEAKVLQYRTEQFDELLGRQQSARRELAAERRLRSSAADAAAAAERTASEHVQSLVDLENRQQELASQVDERLDNAIAEADAIAALDAQASAKLVADEQALAQAASATRNVPPPAPAAPAPTPTPAPATTPTTAPRTPGPTPTTAPPAPAPVTTAPTTTIPSSAVVETVNVRGFVVARSIADPFSRLLAAADAAGLTFGGSGYRDINVQINLRRQHCGPTDYDIWTRPASQCSPPTAIPGRSMHEKGLAVDLTCSGALITSRSSPCFVWLASNAAGFGFYNLPSEPWHWSTNGN